MSEVIVALVTALLGCVVWYAQKREERKAGIRQQREGMYSKLLLALADAHSTKDYSIFVVEAQRAWLYASDDVMKCIHDHYDVLINKKTGMNLSEAKLCMAIRKEVVNTNLPDEWLKCWQPVTSDEKRTRAYIDIISGLAKK